MRQYLKLSSCRFLNKGFVHYLWHDLSTSNAIVACSRLPSKYAHKRSPCNLKLVSCSIQQIRTAADSRTTQSTSYPSKLNLVLASHNNFGTCPDCSRTWHVPVSLLNVGPPNWLSMLGCYILLSSCCTHINLPTSVWCTMMSFVAMHACCLCWNSADMG